METKQVAEERAYFEGGHFDGAERGVYPPGRVRIDVSVESDVTEKRHLTYLRTDRRHTIGDTDVPVYELQA